MSQVIEYLKEPEIIASKVREILKSSIYELFDQPISKYKSITPFAFTVVTALAEGADRLVANEIMRTPDSEIEVILPFAKNEYVKDFQTLTSKKEFEELYQISHHHIIIKKDMLKELHEKRNVAKDRQKAYEGTGQYIVDHCDMLIAIWDGKPSRGKGGTADIVTYTRKMKCPLIILSSEDPNICLVEKGIGLNSESLLRLNMFDRFSVREEVRETYINNVYRNLFDTPEGMRIPDEVKNSIREKLLPFYVHSSILAKVNQRSYLAAGLLVYILSPLAVAAVTLGMLNRSLSLPAFIIEFIVLLFIFIVIFKTDRKQAHKRWIESRFLVERIRSAIFLISCGVKPSPIIIPRYMKSSLSSIDWAIRVFDEIERGVGNLEKCCKESLNSHVDFIRKQFIQDQINFHLKKSYQTGKISKRLENFGMLIFFIAIGIAAIHLLSTILNNMEGTNWLEQPIFFLAIVLPVVGASIGGIRTHREYARLEKRSKDMAAALNGLDHKFAETTTIQKFKDLLHDTEKLMLQETQEWLTLMKFVKVEHI